MQKLVLVFIGVLIFGSCEHWHCIEIKNTLDSPINAAISLSLEYRDSLRKDTLIEGRFRRRNMIDFRIISSRIEELNCHYLSGCNKFKVVSANTITFQIPAKESFEYWGGMNIPPKGILESIDALQIDFKDITISAKNTGVSTLFKESKGFINKRRIWTID